MQIPADDGFSGSKGTLTFPPVFDRTKKYPVLARTPTPPRTPVVRNSGGPSVNLNNAANVGIIMFQLDPRSASGKRRVHLDGLQAARPGAQDIECGVNWLTEKPYVDGNRIGMNGHSYGGFMTAYALTHSTLFAAGISGSPSPIGETTTHLHRALHGHAARKSRRLQQHECRESGRTNSTASLLLLHGLMDDNVHPQNSIQFMELQRANKDFEVMFYPGNATAYAAITTTA